ncbi:MAG TPA: hypothetical protein VGA21_14655 [Cyclobacteriaceae bacterium]|jgi:quercetin dioxygenase-like cupin family protein
MEIKGTELEKCKVYITANVIDYLPDSIITRTILNKNSGNVKVTAIDSSKVLKEVSPFDSLIQIIEGKAEIVIDELSILVEAGQFIIVPAHSHNFIRATERFKMFSTVIKSGYEDVV